MPGQIIVTIGNKQWQCTVANTPQELVTGLSGVQSIPPGTGMLFDMGWDYPVIDIYTDEMLFPLDIIFINSAYGVIEVLRNVRPEDEAIFQGEPGAAFFLEVNAGETEGVEVGDGVMFQPGEYVPIAPTWTEGLTGLIGFVAMGFFMVIISRELVKRALEEPEEKPALLPRTSPKQPTNQYEIETDRMGNIIITRTDYPGKDVFLQFEADRDLVYGLLRKGERKDLDAGWEVRIKRSEPRASTLDELWQSSAHLQRSPRTFQKPSRSDVTVNSWVERDRIGIWLTDRRTGKTIAEWWDDDAREMFEQGWFGPGDIKHQTLTGRSSEESVLDYAESVGILAGGILAETKPTGTCYADAWRFVIREGEGTLVHGTVYSGNRRIGHAWVETATGWIWEPETGKYFTDLGFRANLAPIVESRYTAEEAAIMAARTKHFGPWTEQERQRYLEGKSPSVISECRRQPRLKGELDFLPDSPEFLAYTIDDIGYREKIDSAFLNAIARAKGGY